MGRTILAVLAGIVVMSVIVAGVQWIGHSLFPPPPGIDPRDHDAMVALIAQMPVGALLIVLVAYLFGTFLGAGTAATISARHKRGAAIAVGVAMLVLVAANFAMIPHPLWMVVAGVLIPLPAALLGWRVFR